MWPFNKPTDTSGTPSAVALLCRSIVSRYWEWEPYYHLRDRNEQPNHLVHVGGAAVSWDETETSAGYATGVTVPRTAAEKSARMPGVWAFLYNADRRAVIAAVRMYAAKSASGKRRPLGATAEALARAVLDPRGVDLTAARALADWVCENVNKPPGDDDGHQRREAGRPVEGRVGGPPHARRSGRGPDREAARTGRTGPVRRARPRAAAGRAGAGRPHINHLKENDIAGEMTTDKAFHEDHNEDVP